MTLHAFLMVALFLFCLGIYAVLARRHLIGILIGIELRVRGVLNGAVTGLGDISYISQLGVTTNEAGRLQLDEATLTSALKENRDSVIGFFSAESGGFATRLDTILGGFLDSGGVMDGVLDGANRRVDDIGQSRDSLERRMESIEQRYRDQFTALDTLISGLTATSDYLTGQLEQLSNLTNYYRDR